MYGWVVNLLVYLVFYVLPRGVTGKGSVANPSQLLSDDLIPNITLLMALSTQQQHIVRTVVFHYFCEQENNMEKIIKCGKSTNLFVQTIETSSIINMTL